MTKQDLKRDIMSQYPGQIRLNCKETGKVIGKHPNRVRAYMAGCMSEKFGVGRYYFISDIAERMIERSGY